MVEFQALFIGGLHRSGTSPFARYLAQHPEISALENTGVPEDEGQHLQTVYTPAYHYGGPGAFAFAKSAHLTERDVFDPAYARERLLECWLPYWDACAPFLMEKSPPNLIRLRYLQAIFPEAHFLVVIRHPIPVSFATKNQRSRRLSSLLRHWLEAHSLLLSDAPQIKRLRIVPYEAIVADPNVVASAIWSWLGLQESSVDRSFTDQNAKYFHRWKLMQNGATQPYARYLACRFENQIAPFGYSLQALDAAPTNTPSAFDPWLLTNNSRA